MGLTQVSKDGVKNDAIDASKLPANSVGASELADNAVDTNAITNDAVTISKIQNVAQDRILGRQSSGSGDLQELNAGNVRLMLNVADGANQTTINSNADNRVITGSDTANTLNGESSFLSDGTRVGINSSGGAIADIPGTSHDTLVVGNSTMTSGGIVLQGAADTSGNLGFQFFKGGSVPCARVLYEGSGNELQFHSTTTAAGTAPAAEARKVRILPNGDVVIDNGDLLVASGHGIDFSANSNASGSTSELFDDYEEGTFTPSLSTGYSSISYHNQTGFYTKIGNLVHFSIYIYVYQATGSADPIRITLPFTSINQTRRESGAYATYDNGTFSSSWDEKSGCGFLIGAGSNVVRPIKRTNGAQIYGNDTALGTGANNRYFHLSGQFYAP